MGVIQFDRQNRYDAGPNLAAFWDHDEARLPAITRQAVLRLVGYQTGHPFWHPKAPEDSCLIEFLSLFFTCFRGLALVESEVGQIFARLHPTARGRPDPGGPRTRDRERPRRCRRVEEEARCQGPEGPGRRPLHVRVGLLRRAQEDEDGLVLRQPDRPGHAGTRAVTPRTGTRHGLQGPARPFRLRRSRSGLGDSLCPCSVTARSSGSTRSTSSGSIGRGWPGHPRPAPRVRNFARCSANWSLCLRPWRTCLPRNRRSAARSASAGAVRWSSPRAPKSWPRSATTRN